MHLRRAQVTVQRNPLTSAHVRVVEAVESAVIGLQQVPVVIEIHVAGAGMRRGALRSIANHALPWRGQRGIAAEGVRAEVIAPVYIWER